MHKKMKTFQRTKITMIWYEFSYDFSIQNGEKISLGKTYYSFGKLDPSALPAIQKIAMNKLLLRIRRY